MNPAQTYFAVIGLITTGLGALALGVLIADALRRALPFVGLAIASLQENRRLTNEATHLGLASRAASLLTHHDDPRKDA